MNCLPGLIDPHVHLREPGAIHKEDWDSGTATALAGGFSMVLAMPNTKPPICDAGSLWDVLKVAKEKARCDYAQYLGVTANNAAVLPDLAGQAAGIKMYLDQTYGPLCLEDRLQWIQHFKNWPSTAPLAIHAEGSTLAEAIHLAEEIRRPIHLCHISKREDVLLIRAAKERGAKVTCEVTPHHLFLTEADVPAIGSRRAEVRPTLGSLSDQQALWENMDVIDCFASDHAPHTLMEKDGTTPPPGFPGLETALPLYLTAVNEGRLSIDDVIARCLTNPQRIFHLPAQIETWVEVDMQTKWEIHAADLHSRCGWTPFEGRKVTGQIRRVVLHGREAYKDGQVLSKPGTGSNVRSIADNENSFDKEKYDYPIHTF